jgi:hypothetical protein
MPYVIGVDEAGYGPNLGPLVISATVWQAPAEVVGADWFKATRRWISSRPPAAKDKSRRPAKVAIADSKALYQPGNGLGTLELGVLAGLVTLGVRLEHAASLWERLAPACCDDRRELPWHQEENWPVPVDIESDAAPRGAEVLSRCGEATGIRLIQMRSRAIFPRRFNETVEELGNKAEALSRWTLELVASLLDELPDDSIHVICDKHGGRDFYGPLLQRQFPEWLVEVRKESHRESIYAWGPAQRRIECRFRVEGEAVMPTAMASMASKYLREVAMRSFNDYWRARLPELRPTAGYHGDAHRFRREIAATQRTLGLDDALMWRSR